MKMVWTWEGLISISELKEYITIAEKQDATYIGLKNNNLWMGFRQHNRLEKMDEVY